MPKLNNTTVTEPTNKYSSLAIAYSKESAKQGCFPVGAVLVTSYKGQEITYSGLSGNSKDKKHAEQNVIINTISGIGEIPPGSVLYSSMEPCLMCLMTAYWYGVKEIHYVIGRDHVNSNYFESPLKLEDINGKLYGPIKLINDDNLEDRALEIVKEWEESAP